MGNSFTAIINPVIGVVFSICHGDKHVKVRNSSVDELVFTALDLFDDPGRRSQVGRGTPHTVN